MNVMKRNLLLFIFMMTFGFCNTQDVQFLSYNSFFKNKTMRVDYFHTGNAEEEHFRLIVF